MRLMKMLAGIMLGFLALTCGDDSGDKEQQTDGETVKTTIGEDGGTVASADGAIEIIVPPGALAEDVEISVETVEPGDLPNAEGRVGDVYDLKPDGQQFLRSVAISISADQPAAGQKVFVSTLNESAGEWVEVGSLFGDGRVVAMVDHFSTYTSQAGAGQQVTPFASVVVTPGTLMNVQPPESWSRRWEVHSRTVTIKGNVLPNGTARWVTKSTPDDGTFEVTNGGFEFAFTIPAKNFAYPVLYSSGDNTQYWLELWCSDSCEPAGGDTDTDTDTDSDTDTDTDSDADTDTDTDADTDTDTDSDTDPADPGPTPTWSFGYGSSETYAMDLTTDASGNIYVVGSMRESGSFGGDTLTSTGLTDVFLAKYDASGTHVWSKLFGGAGMEFGRRIAMGPEGNLFFIGTYAYTFDFDGTQLLGSSYGNRIYVAKYDTNGNQIWVNGYGGTMGTAAKFGNGIATFEDGIYVTGYYTETLDFGGPTLPDAGYDEGLYVAKLDLAGDHVWSIGFPGVTDGQIWGEAVAVDSNGDALVCGTYLEEATVGGTTLPAGIAWNAFAAKYSGSDGTHLWSVRLAENGSGDDLIADTADDVIIVGTGDDVDSTQTRILLAKHSGSDGSQTWRRTFGNYTGALNGIALDASNNIFVTGAFRDAVNLGDGLWESVGYQDILAARFNPSGETVAWSHGWGKANGTNEGEAIAMDSNGDLVLTGRVDGLMDFGNGPIADSVDMFLIKLPPVK